MMGSKLLFVLALASLVLLYGCINLGGEPAKPSVTGPGTGETPGTGNPNQSGSEVVIISKTNQTQGTSPDQGTTPGQEKPAGAQYGAKPDDTFYAYFIDLDRTQASDAVYIKKGDLDILYGAGLAKDGAKLVDFLKTRGVDDIDVLIIPVAKEKYYGGANAVLDAYTVQEIWWTGDLFNQDALKGIIDGAESSKTLVKTVQRDDVAELAGIKFQTLNPSPKRFNNPDDPGNDCIVFKISNGNSCIMLTGDVLTGAQGEMGSYYGDGLRCDVLQVPYEGLGRGNNQIALFLNKVKPVYSIMNGAVDGSDSRDSVKNRLRTAGTTNYETYVGGTVKFTSDGTGYAVQYVK
ncbi:MAG: ComEC/Rec2 family competence protein [Candidatus Bilamarchaeaceae archaeon]